MRIGIFDSGLGGLTVYRQVQQCLPQYDYTYLGDNARTPYGNRSFEAILKFTREGVESLFLRECQLIVIACNTASAKALRTLQQQYLPLHFPDRRLLGVIRPSTEALSHYPLGSRVAIWATEGTVRSQSYALELAKLAPSLELNQKACPMLVPLVESGELSGPGLHYFIHKYWDETVSQGGIPKALLLACTHYPLLFEAIRRCVPPETEILMQGELVAPRLQEYLIRHPEIESRLSRHSTQQFLTTDQSEGFDSLASLFLGSKVMATRIEI